MARILRHLSANTDGSSLVAALILAGLLAQCFMTLARGASQTAVLLDEIVHRPTVIPDRILLCWFADPATLQAVTWRTDLSVIESCGEIAVASDGPRFTDRVHRVTATSVRLDTDLGSARLGTTAWNSMIWHHPPGTSTGWVTVRTGANGYSSVPPVRIQGHLPSYTLVMRKIT